MLLVVALRVIMGLALAGLEIASPTPPQEDGNYYHEVTPHLSLAGQLFVKWDSYWYLNIVEYGYQLPAGEMPQSNLAFAPFYPALVFLLTLVGLPAWLAGVLISQLCFLLMLYYLFQLGVTLHSRRLGCYLMLFTGAFPSAWTLHMVYSESLFCLVLAAFFTHYLRKQYLPAGIFGLLLLMTRIAGVVLLPAIAADLAWRYWKEKRLPQAWISLLLVTAGLLCLGLVYYYLTESPTAFSAAGRTWFAKAGVEGRFLPLVASFAERLTETPLALFYLAFFLLYAFCSAVLLKRDRDICGWFSLLYMIMLLKTPLISAQMRYLLPLLPVHACICLQLADKKLFGVTMVILLFMQLFLTRFVLTWSVIM